MQHGIIRTLLRELRPRPRPDYDDRDAARQADLDISATQVLTATEDPILRAVLNLHRPVIEPSCPWPVCHGCDNLEGAAAEPPEWPCRTWSLIQQELAP